jgi:TP901 family phage tail tape measure protein
MAKVIAYQLRIDGQDLAVRNARELADAIKETKKALDTTDFGSKEYRQLETRLARLKATQKGVRDDQRDLAKQFRATANTGKGSYRDLQKTLTSLKTTFKNLSEEERKFGKGRELQRKIRQIDGELKRLDRSLGDNFRNVGNYRSALSGFGNSLKGALGAAGVVVGVNEIRRAMQEAINVYSKFNEEQAKLGAISRSINNPTALAALEEDALRLGATTEKTASQVTQLQIAYARAGFSVDEILAATEATLDLSTATGEDLTRSSEVAANNLRAFQLAAGETGRVTDVITASINSSNQALEDYAEASKLLAPIANTLNVSIEEASAVIGILADNGLKGSIATQSFTTSLQNLTNESSKQARAAKDLGVEIFNQEGQFLGFTEVIRNLNKALAGKTAQEKLSAISAIFGARATRNWAILLNAQKEATVDGTTAFFEGADAIEAYTKQLEQSEGAAKTAADFIRDTLAGDIKVLESTIEGAQLNFVAKFEDELRAGVQIATQVIRDLSSVLDQLVTIFTPAARAIKEFSEAIKESGISSEISRESLDAFYGALRLGNNILADTFGGLKLVTTAQGEFEKKGVKAGGSGILKIILRPYRLMAEATKDAARFLNGFMAVYENAQAAFYSGNQIKFDPGKAWREGVKDIEQFYEANRREEEKTRQKTNKTLADEKRKQSTEEDPASSEAKKRKQELEDLLDLIEDGLGDKGPGKSLSPFERLTQELQKLEAQARDAFASGKEPSEELTQQIQEQTRKVNDARAAFEAYQNRLANPRTFSQPEALRERDFDFEVVPSSSRLQDQFQNIYAPAYAELEQLQKQSNERRAETEKALQANLLLTEEQRAERIKRAYLENEIELLEIAKRMALLRGASVVNIEKQIAEQRAELARTTGENLAQTEFDLLADLRNRAFALSAEISTSFFDQEREELEGQRDMRIQMLEEEYARRLELAEGNAAEEERLQRELTNRREQIEREALKRRQQLEIKQAIINTALAVGNALATVKPFAPAAIIAAAYAAAQGAIQVATIKSQTYAEGGFAPGWTGLSGKPVDGTGEHPVGSKLHSRELVFVATRRMAQNKKVQAMFRDLERMRLSMGHKRRGSGFGYAEGGLISASQITTGAGSQAPSSDIQVEARLREEDAELIGAYVQLGAAQGTQAGAERGVEKGATRNELKRNLESRLEF